MTFVTKLTLQSGDRYSLERCVSDIQTTVERKGAELKGPHSSPPTRHRVPLYVRLFRGNEEFSPWEYTVYTRRLEIVGHDEVARHVAHRKFPSDIHVEVEVEQIHPLGHGR